MDQRMGRKTGWEIALYMRQSLCIAAFLHLSRHTAQLPLKMTSAVTSLSRPQLVSELASFIDTKIGNKSSVGAEVNAKLKNRDFIGAFKFILDNSEQLWEVASDKSLESFYALFGSFLFEPRSPLRDKLLLPLLDVVTKGSTKEATRLAILNNLYNSNTAPEWQVPIFEAILTHSIKWKQTTILEPLLSDLDKLFVGWQLKEEDVSRLNSLLYKLLSESEPWISHVFMTRWIESFKTEDAAKSHQQEIASAITSMIARKDVFRYDSVQSSAAAKSLSKTNPGLVNLLDILTSGGIQEFEALASKEASLFVSPLSIPDLRHKMQILTLLSLVAKQPNLPYSTISQQVGIDINQVEELVLDALAEGILNAKLDHLTNSLFATYVLQRQFGKPQWEELRDKVNTWRDNIGNMLQVLKQSRHSNNAEKLRELHATLSGIAQ